MYSRAEGKKNTSVFEELLLYRFFTLCDLLQHRHHHHHVLFFGSFDLNLVLWCDVVVVVVGDSFQISWLILKFLCRDQQQHLEQRFIERAFEDCTLIVLSPVSAFFNGTALPSSLAYIQTINAERPWRFCAAHLTVSLEALHRCSSWLLFFAHKKTSFLTLFLLLLLLGERSCC